MELCRPLLVGAAHEPLLDVAIGVAAVVGEASDVASQAAVEDLSSGGVVVEEVEVARVLIELIDASCRLCQVDDFTSVLVNEAALGDVVERLETKASLAVPSCVAASARPFAQAHIGAPVAARAHFGVAHKLEESVEAVVAAVACAGARRGGSDNESWSAQARSLLTAGVALAQGQFAPELGSRGVAILVNLAVGRWLALGVDARTELVGLLEKRVWQRELSLASQEVATKEDWLGEGWV